MALAFLAFAVLAPTQTGPSNQAFNFTSEFSMLKNEVRLTVTRTIKTVPRRIDEQPKTYPPYEWSVSSSKVRVRFLPVSGQTTQPKVTLLPKSFPSPKAPDANVSFFDGQGEGTAGTYKLDWTGCKPGFYQMEAHATVDGETGSWTMTYDHQTFYWRPISPPKDVLSKGQTFLVTEPHGGRFQFGSRELYGTTMRLENVDKKARWQLAVRMRSTKTGATVSATFPSSDNMPGLAPVFVDSETRELRRRYVGKTVYPMGMYLAIQADPYATHLGAVKRGEAEVVIRDIWRAARPMYLGHVDPTITGDRQFFLSGWYPIFVVFDTKTPDLVLQYEQELDKSGPIIAVLPDAWAFERQFSLTSKKADFPDWKPRSNSLKEPVFPEPGMTPKQLAWLQCWPAFIGPMAETVKLNEWRYEPEGYPPTTFRFQNGRLVMGPGVVKY